MTFSSKPQVQHDFDMELCLAEACAQFGVTPRDLHFMVPAAFAPDMQMGAQKYRFTFTLMPAEMLKTPETWAVVYSPRNLTREQLEDGFGRNMPGQFYWSEGS
jgi:hypothetical protein